MLIDIFRLSDGYNAVFETGLLQPAHCLDVPLSDDRDNYVITIDPGTVSLGMIIGDVVSGYPLYWINLQRSSNGTFEETQDTFVSHCLIFFENLFKSGVDPNTGALKYRYLKIERPFVDKNKARDTYVALKKVMDGLESLSKQKGMSTFPTPPKSWEAWYLAPYKEPWGLNLNASNKASIKRVGMEFLSGVHDLLQDQQTREKYMAFLLKVGAKGHRSDTFDALGLFKHFMAVDYSEKDIIRVNPSMPRSFKNVNVAIYAYREKATQSEKASSEIVQSIKDRLERTTGDRIMVKQFNYCSLLTASENIKALIEHAGENNLYISVTNLTLSLFPDLYDNTNFKVNNLSQKTLILVVGYRSR